MLLICACGDGVDGEVNVCQCGVSSASLCEKSCLIFFSRLLISPLLEFNQFVELDDGETAEKNLPMQFPTVSFSMTWKSSSCHAL